MSELSNKIRDAPNFPPNQVPVQFDRAFHAIERIILAPLGDTKDDHGAAHDDSTPQGILHLNFVFAESPSDKMIKELARALDRALKIQEMPITRIAMGGFTSWDDSQASENGRLLVSHAVKQFKRGLKKRKLGQDIF